jgi:hypothetical protein
MPEKSIINTLIAEATINGLHSFACQAKPALFEKIFGEQIGEHLWGKFVSHNHEPIAFWGYLDLDNQRKLVKYIEQEVYKELFRRKEE